MALSDRFGNLGQRLSRLSDGGAGEFSGTPQGGTSYGEWAQRNEGGGSFGAGLFSPTARSGGSSFSFGNVSGGAEAGFDWIKRANASWGYSSQERKRKEAEQAAAYGNKPPGSSGPNTGYTGASEWLARERANSPIIPYASDLAAYAISKNVDPALIFGLLRKESQYGSDTGMGTQRNNPGNIMIPNGLPASGANTQTYPDLMTGLKAMVDLLAAYHKTYGPMFGKEILSTEDLVAIYYVGPQAYKARGLAADDGAGNGTVQDYLNQHIYPVRNSYNSRPGAQAPTPSGRGTGGLEALWGGTVGQYGVSQEFGQTDFSDQHPYHYGADFGVGTGHHGLDIDTPHGTPLYSPVGGKVIIAGGSGYYRDDGGDGPGRGELRILLDNGHEIIIGHMSRINVRVGQRVDPYTYLGLSGTASGAHTHLEYRIPDASLNSGWRAVDPRTYLKPSGGSQGGTAR